MLGDDALPKLHLGVWMLFCPVYDGEKGNKY